MYNVNKFHIDFPLIMEDMASTPSVKIIYFERLRAFIMSKAFMVFCLALATLFFALETEVQGIITFLLFISIILIFERDIMPTYLPILLAAMSVLRMYDSFNIFKNYAWIIVIVIISVVFHIIYYRPRKMQRGKRLGKLFFPYVAVSAALLLGGIGSITSAEYFNPTTLYYVLALGVGMLVSYLIFHKYINPRRDYDTKEYFAFAMFIAGVFAFIMLALQYATNAIPALLGPPFTYNIIERFFSISNNLSTIILMIMPFSFYVAAKKKYGVICFISGVLQGFTMLFSSSRSGLFFSFALTLPLIIITMYLDKAKRKQYAIALAIIAALVAIIIVVGYEKIWIPMFTNYAFRLQDNWKMYLLIAIASILVVSYFIALYVMPKRLQRVLVLATAAVFLIMCAGVFVFWEKALVILVKMDYSRGMMADLAMKNFYRFPIFGTGIGYSGTDAYYQPRTATMHFYHSAPIQIIGSMGLVGVIAYAYMFVSRIRLLRQNKSFFNFTIYLCTLGLYLMSLVNPGIFVPLMFMLQLTLYYVLAEQNTKTTAKR